MKAAEYLFLTGIFGCGITVAMSNELSKWRAARKFTQAEAGSLVEVSQATWAKWEGGQVPPEQCLKVHEVTGIALHVLRPDVYPVPQRRATDRRKAGAQ